MPDSQPDVTVVVPNWNGRHHLERCFRSLGELVYGGAIELVLVDNGSRDGSLEFMERRFPGVRLVRNQTNAGFAVACNRGAAAASGKIIAFLNNDMRVERNWLAELVGGLSDGARCAGSLIMSWDGRRVNYAGGGMNFHGIGIQVGLDDTDVSKYREPADTLFACGGAMAVDRELFLATGGFDEDYFAYYEDVDFGWRLWVLGEKVRYVPSSIAYHHHSATSSRIDVHRIRLLQIRNPLFTIFKNYDEENVRKALPAALMVTLRRTRYLLALDENQFSMKRDQGLVTGPFAALRVKARARRHQAQVPWAGLADVLAINEFMDWMPRFLDKRRSIQERRLRGDAEILPLFVDPFWKAETSSDYRLLHDVLLRFFGLEEVLGGAVR